MDIYNQLKNLFKTNERTFKIFYDLKSRLSTRCGKTLIICANKREAIIERKKFKNINHVIIKSINELENDTMDGYIFKNIFFKENAI